MRIKQYISVAVLCLTAVCTANAATIFGPTDSDVNFLFGDLQGGILGLFDDGDQGYTGSHINVPVPSIVGFTGPTTSGDFIATNELAQSVLLTGSSNFILGLGVDNGAGGITWLADSAVIANGANSYTVQFNNGGSVLEVDVRVVPVPAAAWLFGSGLLGLAGMARRRRVCA